MPADDGDRLPTPMESALSAQRTTLDRLADAIDATDTLARQLRDRARRLTDAVDADWAFPLILSP